MNNESFIKFSQGIIDFELKALESKNLPIETNTSFEGSSFIISFEGDVVDNLFKDEENKKIFFWDLIPDFSDSFDISKYKKSIYNLNFDYKGIYICKESTYSSLSNVFSIEKHTSIMVQGGLFKNQLLLKTNIEQIDDSNSKELAYIHKIIKSVINILVLKAKLKGEEKDYKEIIMQNGGKFYNCENLGFKRVQGYKELKGKIKNLIIDGNKYKKKMDEYLNKIMNNTYINGVEAYLFHGNPGNGKTNMARAIAEELDIPMIYINIENITSKWYGEQEKKLNEIFNAIDNLGRSLIFFDEIDSFVGKRDNFNVNETTIKTLGILIRYIEGLEKGKDNVIIMTTNLKNNIDHALISRCKEIIEFNNPNEKDLIEISNGLLKHLNKNEKKEIISKLLESNKNLSIRDFINKIKGAIKSGFNNYKENSILPNKDLFLNYLENNSI